MGMMCPRQCRDQRDSKNLRVIDSAELHIGSSMRLVSFVDPHLGATIGARAGKVTQGQDQLKPDEFSSLVACATSGRLAHITSGSRERLRPRERRIIGQRLAVVSD